MFDDEIVYKTKKSTPSFQQLAQDTDNGVNVLVHAHASVTPSTKILLRSE
jgi:hypothetical protein